MSTKSYTLADGTTATVNATSNGIPFNEGMNVLSKAIKAKINTSSGGGTTKPIPTLTVDTTSITDEPLELDTDRFHLLRIPVEYDGDGELFCRVYNIDTYNVTAGFDTTTPDYFYVMIFSVQGGFEDLEAISGTLYARESANYAAADCEFNFELPALE